MSRGSLPSLEDDFSRALLGSAETDGPSNAAYAKAAAALGIGVGLGVGASLPAPAAVAAGAAGAAGIARWSSSLGGKLLALGVSTGLFVGAAVLLLGSSEPSKPASGQASGASPVHATREPSRASSPSLASARQLVSPPVLAPVSPATAATSTEQLARPAAPRPPLPAPSAHRAARASAVHASPVPASSTRGSTGSSLAEQVQSLDRARVALTSGDAGSALREIAHYRAAWPDGVFLTEASVLEIEALAARGERSLARTRAADFVAAHPDSPQADRLRALVPTPKR